MDSRVDEQAVRDEIAGRHYNVTVHADWLTPAGNQRSAPMYEAEVSNAFLGVSKLVRGRTPEDVEQKVRKQHATWADKEVRARVSEAKDGLKGRATDATREAQEQLQALREILSGTFTVDDRLDWEALMATESFPARPFDEREPERPSPPPKPVAPGRHLFHMMVPALERRRLARVEEIETIYRQRCEEIVAEWRRKHAAWARAKGQHEAFHARERDEFLAAQQRKNSAISEFKRRFESGETDAIDEYCEMVFERSSYPNRFVVEHDCHFDADSDTMIVNVSLPAPDDLDTTSEYKTVDRHTRMEALKLKPREASELYDEATKQTVLRTIHEVFESCYTEPVQGAVVNGWATVTNRSTGHDETSCIISVSADRESFEAINLERIDSTECIRNLRGLIVGPLAQVAPVKPIMTFDRDDPRFVESNDVLAEYNSRTNLAEIPWEEFEHLVRELFGKIFAEEGVEVRVTQASRDAGVDAIVFDPDPIRGGKFVIQAKRYTNVVGVSAVRDLYGTMINEGATKGILVSTSYYGRDSREFAKDKPITLIDGSNLIHLLQEHGHEARIDLEAARRLREGGEI